jgi:phage tail protein X
VTPPAKTERVRPAVPEARSEVPPSVPVKPAADERPASSALPTLLPVEKSPAESKEQKPEGLNSPPPNSNSSGLKAAAVTGGARQKIIQAAMGDNLFSIAQRSYGRVNITLVDHVLESNPEIENMDLIQVDQKIAIPGINEESFLAGSPGSGYRVHLGTFEFPQSAIRYRNESVLKGKNLEVIPREVSPGTTWYRLVAGKFETQEEALNTIQQLKKMNLLPAFVKKR